MEIYISYDPDWGIIFQSLPSLGALKIVSVRL